jgi:hypothetical protein
MDYPGKGKLIDLLPVMRPKVEASIEDVQGKYDPDVIRIGIFETLRSLKQQRINVAKGVSRTMDSKHLADEDGFSEAADVVPFVKNRWGLWVASWKSVYGADGRDVWDYLTSAAKVHGLVRVWFKGPHGLYVDGPHLQWGK